MNFIADLHIHSRYSRATSKNLDLENLYIAAQIKGITVLGTGDFTHPAWWAAINEKLVPAEEGLFALNPEIAGRCDAQVPQSCRGLVRFVLVTEVSNIYKKNGKTRKNHNLIFMPGLDAAGDFIQKLDRTGNINSDGRPILGLDARNLLEIMLECTDQGYLIPAHIWTPWFSLLGSKSGFDAVEECFDDLTPHIFALETGLSSDPPMNWRVSQLDRYTLVSNSDAHSPAKLGREANLFDTSLSYPAIRKALESGNPQSFLGTVEFFPEEGKYHVDGHRKCSFRSLPGQTRELNGICPVCHKPLTLGVLYRVEELADRPNPVQTARSRSYQNLIPLENVLAEVFECGNQTKRVQQAYRQLVDRFGSEFDILRDTPVEALEKSGIALLAEAIARMRNNRIHFEAGYDGEFGRVRIFDPAERQALMGQQSLFDMADGAAAAETLFPCEPEPMGDTGSCAARIRPAADAEAETVLKLNAEQQSAVDHDRGPLMIVAGPGTGKTRTITCRMAELIGSGRVSAERILAVTFTNKAAEEMRQRLTSALGGSHDPPLTVTFHGLCWRLLQEAYDDRQSAVVDDDVRDSMINDAVRQVQSADRTVSLSTVMLRDHIAKAKQQMLGPGDDLSTLMPASHADMVAPVYKAYQDLLLLQERYDFEDLIFQTVRLMEADGQWRRELRRRYTHVFVDEFQDINLGQYRLLRLLAPGDAELCVIGDPDQAIYGFRGSDVRFFQKFSEDYRKTRVIRLVRNYRSSEAILESSHQMIQAHRIAMQGQDPVPTYSRIEGFKTISILESPSARAEAVAIGQTIEQMVGGTGFQAVDFGKVDEGGGKSSFDDFAVLYRTADQGRLLAEMLSQAGIPCQLVSNQALQQQPQVAKLLAALRVVTDQGCYADLDRLSDLAAPGISIQTLSIFKSWAYSKQLPLATALNTALRLPLPGMSTARQQRLAAAIRRFKTLKQSVAGGKAVAEILSLIVSGTTLAASDQTADLQQIIALAEPFGTDIRAFLCAMALRRDTDCYRPDVEKVALMTMHAAKGLEFNVLFVAGCEDDLIPYRRPGKAGADLEEERRLFYVAMTRARERLFLSWARKRTLYGKTAPRNLSPFVDAIEKRLKAAIAVQPKSRKAVQQQMTLF